MFSLTTIQPEQCFQSVSAKIQRAKRHRVDLLGVIFRLCFLCCDCCSLVVSLSCCFMPTRTLDMQLVSNLLRIWDMIACVSKSFFTRILLIHTQLPKKVTSPMPYRWINILFSSCYCPKSDCLILLIMATDVVSYNS